MIPSEDEWYKATYHDPGSGVYYYDYPTGTDAVPSNVLSDPNPDPGNNANLYVTDYTIGSPYYRTVGGDFENSQSPYGTFDQAGNLWEWNDTVNDASYRGLRGGSYGNTVINLHAAYRIFNHPGIKNMPNWGFRVAEVSEQAPVPTLSEWGIVVMTLLTLTAGTLVWAKRSTAVV